MRPITRAAIRRRWRSAVRCERPRSPTKRCGRSSGRRVWCPWRPASTVRTRRWRKSRWRRKTAREFRAVLALGPVDRAAAHADLAESYFKSGKRDEAKKQTIAALEIAPTYERAQDLLLKLTEGRP